MPLYVPPSGGSSTPETVRGLFGAPGDFGHVGDRSGTIALSLNRLDLLMVEFAPDTALDRLGLFVTSGAASSFLRFGLWEDDAGRPGALIVDTGQVDSSGTGDVTATIAEVVSGRTWAGYVAQGGTPTVYALAGQGPAFPQPVLTSVGNVGYGSYVSGVSGALPDPCSALSGVYGVFGTGRMGFRYA